MRFLGLASSSPAINAGTDIGLPYSGSAPDLGALQYADYRRRSTASRSTP